MGFSKAVHSRTGAVVAGATVLAVLGGAGGAVAAGLITSADIKDDTIRSRDIKDGTIRQGDIDPTALNRIKIGAVPSGRTIRGAVGADYHNTTGSGLSDHGIVASLPRPARNALGDAEVEVNVEHWKSGSAGQVEPTSGDTGDTTCTGTVAWPTAPAGVVCIYVAGSDNATNVVGYSVRPGTGQSPYGFKLKWDIPTGEGDTFVDAVWAYTAP